MDEIQLLAGMDAHVHWRDGEMRAFAVPQTARAFEYGLFMPNTRPHPLRTCADMFMYGQDCDRIASQNGHAPFRSVGTIQFTQATSIGDIYGLRAVMCMGACVGGAKVYFAGTTTNSENGITISQLLEEKSDQISAMESFGFPLLVHLENVDEPEHQKREGAALFVFEELVKRYPRLKLVLEHVSSREGIDLVKALPDTVAATITAHHPILTWDDVGAEPGGHVRHPHCLCMPVVKTASDRDAVLEAMVSGNPKFFFGSDSAPHPTGEKEDPSRAWPTNPPNFGVYSADVATEVLAETFEKYAGVDWIQKLNAFRGIHGPAFYRLPTCTRTIRLIKRSWRVPDRYPLVTSFRAGRTLAWRLIP